MNRWTILALIFCIIMLFMGTYGIISNVSLPMVKREAAQPKRGPASSKPPQWYLDNLDKNKDLLVLPPAPSNRKPVRVSPSEAISELQKCRTASEALQKKCNELEEIKVGLQAEVLYLEQRVDELMAQNHRQTSSDGTLKNVGTIVSSAGGIVAIILGIRKERRESNKRRH